MSRSIYSPLLQLIVSEEKASRSVAILEQYLTNCDSGYRTMFGLRGDYMDRVLLTFNVKKNSMYYLKYNFTNQWTHVSLKGSMLKYVARNRFNIGTFLIESLSMNCVTDSNCTLDFFVYSVTLQPALVNLLNCSFIPCISKLVSEYYCFQDCLSDKNLIKTEVSNVNIVSQHTFLSNNERKILKSPYASIVVQKIPEEKKVIRKVLSTCCYSRRKNTKISNFSLTNMVLAGGIRVIFDTEKGVDEIFSTMELFCHGIQINPFKGRPVDWVVFDKLMQGVDKKNTCTLTFRPQSSSLLINMREGTYTMNFNNFDNILLRILWTEKCAKDISFSVECLA